MYLLLAEGLAARKATLKNIGDLETRIAEAAVRYEDDAQDGDEDPTELLAAFNASASEFEDLSTRINRTNNAASLAFDGMKMSVMEAVALREQMLLRQRGLKRIIEAIEGTLGKGRRSYGRTRTKDDIKQVNLLPVAGLRKDANALSERIRRLDLVMQQVNWTTTLLD